MRSKSSRPCATNSKTLMYCTVRSRRSAYALCSAESIDFIICRNSIRDLTLVPDQSPLDASAV